MKKLVKGIGQGAKFLFTKDGGNTFVNLVGSIGNDIKAIKTDPVKRWEGIGALVIKLGVIAASFYLLYKGVITFDQAEELIK